MKKWKIWTAFTTVFLAGVIVGVFGTGMVIKHHFESFRGKGEFREKMRDRFVNRLADQLDLTEAELVPISAEVELTMDEMDAFRHEAEPRIKDILDRGRERIKSHLPPEKQAMLDRMAEERRRNGFGLFHLPPPPPPMPHPIP